MSEGKVTLTPEQIKEISMWWDDGYFFSLPHGHLSSRTVIGGLLATLEESQQQRDIDHANYKTYYAEAIAVTERLVEAQQTIARLNMALTHIRTYEPYSLSNMLTFIESRCQEAFGEGAKES